MGAFPFAESRTAESQGKRAAAVYLFLATKKNLFLYGHISTIEGVLSCCMYLTWSEMKICIYGCGNLNVNFFSTGEKQ